MRYKKIKIDDIITKKDLDFGNLILLASRPGVGKTKTCCNLFKYYSKIYNCLYFDLLGSESSYFLANNEQKRLILNFMSSIEIIKKIQSEIKKETPKFIFIDYWQLLTDTDDWFLNMLLEIYSKHKAVIIITSQLSRKVEMRKHHLPKIKDLNENLFDCCGKCLIISRPYSYGESEDDELHYLLYKIR